MKGAIVLQGALVAVLTAAISATASTQSVQQISLDSITPSKDLWLYAIGQDHERHFCGTKALVKGREVLELQASMFPVSKEVSCERSEKEGLLWCGGGYGRAWIGMELSPNGDGTYELRVAFRHDPTVLWPSIRIEQRMFLDRAHARSCREFGPETVWHAPQNNRFIRRTLARVSKRDASILPRKLFYYDEDGASESPTVGPRMIDSGTEPPEIWWDELDLMGDVTDDGGPCRSCGRQQERCIECWVSGSCNAQLFVRFAPDSNGIIRIRAKIILDTAPTDFGYAPYLTEMIELLGVRQRGR